MEDQAAREESSREETWQLTAENVLLELLETNGRKKVLQVELLDFTRHPDKFEQVLRSLGAIKLDQCRRGPHWNCAKLWVDEEHQEQVKQSVGKKLGRRALELHPNHVITYSSRAPELVMKIKEACKSRCDRTHLKAATSLGYFNQSKWYPVRRSFIEEDADEESNEENQPLKQSTITSPSFFDCTPTTVGKQEKSRSLCLEGIPTMLAGARCSR